MVSFNGLVADPIPKTNFNFSMPPELAAAFESAAAELAGKKERWMVCSAAILMLLEATPEKRSEYVRKCGAAGIARGSFAELLKEAAKKSKSSHRPGVFATLAATTKSGPKKD